MRMRFFGGIVVAISLGANAGSVLANEIVEIPLARKVTGSDVIFTGEVLSVASAKLTHEMSIDYAVVKPCNVIKGVTESQDVKVIFAGPISEADPNCCEMGSSYLFFVEYAKNSLYRSVNGRYGIYGLQDGDILDWNSKEESLATPLLSIEKEILEILNRM